MGDFIKKLRNVALFAFLFGFLVVGGIMLFVHLRQQPVTAPERQASMQADLIYARFVRLDACRRNLTDQNFGRYVACTPHTIAFNLVHADELRRLAYVGLRLEFRVTQRSVVRIRHYILVITELTRPEEMMYMGPRRTVHLS